MPENTISENYFVKHKILENFSPAWFAMTMSWGVNALTLSSVPMLNENNPNSTVPTLRAILRIISIIIWASNGIYWFLFMAFMLSNRQNLKTIFRDTVKPCFCGCMLMGFATFLTGFAVIFKMQILPLVLFYIYIFFSWIMGWMVYIGLLAKPQFEKLKMTTFLLLPTLTQVVAAATGSTLVAFMENLYIKIALIFTSYICLGWGALMSLIIVTTYFYHLLKFGFPKAEICNSTWIVIGPIGHTANSLLKLARNTLDLRETTDIFNTKNYGSKYLASFAENTAAASFITALFLWGLGIFWIGLAITGSFYHSGWLDFKFFQTTNQKFTVTDNTIPKPAPTPTKVPFNIGFWAIIFPIATMTFATFEITIFTQFMFFYVMSWIFCSAVLIVSLVVKFHTVRYVIFKPSEFWSKFH